MTGEIFHQVGGMVTRPPNVSDDEFLYFHTTDYLVSPGAKGKLGPCHRKFPVLAYFVASNKGTESRDDLLTVACMAFNQKN